MSGRTGRKISAVLVLGAIALAGCGGSSKSSASSSGGSGNSSSGSTGNSGSSSGSTGAGAALGQDVQQVNKAVQSYKAATSGVQTKATDPASWDQLSQGAKQAADTINGLTPPSALQSAQQTLGASLSRISANAGKVATDLRTKDTAAAQTDLNEAKAATQAYVTAGAAWATAARAAGGG
jgi:hypothetical protein